MHTEAPDDVAEKFSTALKQRMESSCLKRFGFRLQVNVKSGKSWGALD